VFGLPRGGSEGLLRGVAGGRLRQGSGPLREGAGVRLRQGSGPLREGAGGLTARLSWVTSAHPTPAS
jgi:hypothetical protein